MPEKSSETDGKSLTQRIHWAYAQLPDGERRVSDLVLERPGELAVWTASELAERSGVSNATVSRLFRRLGYVNYDEARQSSRRLREQGSPLYLGDDGARRRAGFVSDLIAEETQLVDSSLSLLNPVTAAEIALALAGARRVRVSGSRNSHFLAEYMVSALAQYRPDVEPLLHPGQTRAEGIAGLGPEDVAVIIGLRRRRAGFTDFVAAAAATGAKVLLIADGSVREAPAHASWTLICAVQTPQVADSYLGAMAVIRALSLKTIKELGVAGRRHLEAVETLHETLSELE